MNKKQKNSIELRTRDQNKMVRPEDIRKSRDIAGYSCNLVINSDGFSAARPFYFSEWYLRDFLKKLTRMAKKLNGSATLKEEYEPDYFKLEVE